MPRTTMYWTASLILAFVCGAVVAQQAKRLRTALDPMDAVFAAPENYSVVFENDDVRLLAVTLRPGETENLHTHQFPSVMVNYQSLPSGRNKLADGTVIELKPLMISNSVPVAIARGPEGPHQATNTGDFTGSFYRLELKTMDVGPNLPEAK